MPPELQNDDLRSTLEAAFQEASGERGDGGAPAGQGAADGAGQGEQAAGQATGGENTDKAADQQEGGAQGRDASGRFAPKALDGQAAAPGQSPAADPAAPGPADEQATRAPHSLPAPLKAKWGSLDPDVRNAFVRLEESTQAAKDEWAKKGERLNRLDEILAPRRDQLQLRGLDEVRAIQALFAAQDMLDRNPLEGLRALAQSYGVDLRQIAGQTNAQGAQPGQLPPQIQAYLQPVLQQVQTLEQRDRQREQAQEAARASEAQQAIETFRNDPANPYFDNVRDEMVAILTSGQAADLKSAYDKACWANPEIRTLLIQQQAEEQARAQAAEQRARADRAKQAAGSVTGAPGAAQQPQTPGGASDSLRDDLKAAWDAHVA